MKALAGMFSLLVVPFMLFNMLGGIVAGIWLALLGEWKTIFLGLILTFMSKWIVSIVLIPAFGIATLGAAAVERGNKIIGWTLLLLQSPWTPIVVIVWEIAMLGTFGNRANAENWFPVWLWSYGAATGVWAYMAREETKSDPENNAGFMAFGAQLAYFILSICVIHFQMAPVAAAPFMLIPLLLPFVIGLLELRARRNRNAWSETFR